jgi:pimeloyl-ACP methyl ester carboxylesterase
MARPSRASLAAALLAAMLCHATPAPAMDAYWTEPAYADYPAQGPDKAIGLVIWNHGVDGQLPQYNGPPVPAMAALAARGWDVIKLNRNPVWENSWSNAGRRHVARVAEEVAAARKQGYRRIVVAGQSYGGAIALAAAGAIDGLWAVIATAPGTGQEMRSDGVVTDKWSHAIAQQTYEQLYEAGKTRIVAVFPDDDEFIGIRRGSEARAILGEKSLPFLIVDETAPLKGHHGAYGNAFGPYATCIAHFLDPASEPPNGEFRCGRDEFAAVRSAIRAAKPGSLASTGARWFGYFETSGQEIVLTVPPATGVAETPVEYAWGTGLFGKFRPGATTVTATRQGDGLTARLGNGATVEARPAANDGMRVILTKTGQAPLVANLLPVGN